MSDEINDSIDWNDETNYSMKERRGNFLLTLCILSWVYIGLMLLTTGFNYMQGTDELYQSIEVFESGEIDTEGNPFAESVIDGSIGMIKQTIEHFEAINLSTMAVLLIGGFSVLLMYNLKKIGFGLYILYSIALPSVSLYFLGTEFQMVLWGAVLGAFVSIAFVIMYGVNLKRMNA